MRSLTRFACATVAIALIGCGGEAAVIDGSTGGSVTIDEAAANPFLQDQAASGKEDTQYLNPDGVEVEVDLEADIEAPDYRLDEGPAILGQFALTYLRKTNDVYLESLAEQASSDERVEWLVDGTWITATEAKAQGAKRTHFRIRGINAVLLHQAGRQAEVGTVITAPVPVKPFSIMADADKACADVGDGHMHLDQGIYWYMWDPDKSGCNARKQDMKVTVSKVLPSKVTYPEYDQLIADGKITMVVLFGQIGDGAITESEIGVRAMNQMARWLQDGGFKEVSPPPVEKGKRLSKLVNGITVEVDLYSPWDFSGLGDFAHFPNFQKALGEHEIVAYDGHSMLGASDFWDKPTYPKFYQIFLYGGCLGYEYYVAPILKGKAGWDKLDVLSSVVEVTANANEYAGPFLAKLLYAIENGYKVSWKDILVSIRTRVGDSTFGMSGVRENCFSPSGASLCGAEIPTDGSAKSWDGPGGVAIPDADAKGISSALEVTDDVVVGSIALDLKIDHSYIGDLIVTLEHDGITATVFEDTDAKGREIDQSFSLADFAGQSSKGTWTLSVVDNAAEDAGTLTSWRLTAIPE